MVGALFVGSMSTIWHGEITPTRARSGVRALAAGGAADRWQPRGALLGMFNMGSTVILLLPPGLARWDAGLEAGTSVRVGRALGTLLS
jgi:phosphatidylserine decarboxylase